MAIKVAINGYGRIGRNVLRAIHESGRADEFEVVAINDLGDAATNAHLTQYDTAHGRFPGTVTVEGSDLVVNGKRIKVYAVRNPAELPWEDRDVDVVLECTGLFTSKAKAGAHLAGGAKKVIISAPGDKDVDGTFVYGVNHDQLKAAHTVISNASCTTNCLAPLAKVLHEQDRHRARPDDHHPCLHQRPGADRRLPLRPASRPLRPPCRRSRPRPVPQQPSASYFPSSTESSMVSAMRVPTINVSVVDLSLRRRARDHEGGDRRRVLKAASEGELKGILGFNTKPLVSDGLQPRPAQLDLRLHADQGHRRHAGARCWPGTTTSGASPTACWT